MTPWTLLDRSDSPDGTRMELLQRGSHFSIRVDGMVLMNSRVHDSEEALAELGLRGLRERAEARVLVGGLGFGFTLAAALARLGPSARVWVSEIAPEVIRWNRERLQDLNGMVLDDPRVTVLERDIVEVFGQGAQRYDAILLDVDNGPRAVGRPTNAWLYMPAGLAEIREALLPGGVLAIWSAGPEPTFSDRLRAAGFEVTLHRTQSHAARTKERHFIWLGTR
jgi:spermidine synthase